jgi:hypothetical protein
MAKKRQYFGQAHAFKTYKGAKSMSVLLVPEEGSQLAEKILRAVNKRVTVEITVHDAGKTGKTQMTVTSKA